MALMSSRCDTLKAHAPPSVYGPASKQADNGACHSVKRRAPSWCPYTRRPLYRFTANRVGDVASLAGYSVSSNGVLAWHPVNPINNTSLSWLDRTGKELGTVGEPANYSNPALSLDERSLAVDVREPQKQRDIWGFDLVRGGRTRLTFDPAEDLNAIWHPDSTRIAFSSDRRGSRELYQKLANGSGDDELLLESKDAVASTEDWSVGGRWLVLNWRRQGFAADLFVLPTSAAREPKPATGSG